MVKMDPLLPEAANMLIQSLAAPALTHFPWNWLTDSADSSFKNRAPVLILIGEKGIKVDWRRDVCAGKGSFVGMTT